MRITHIETRIVYAEWRNWVLVKVNTDEGYVGWGEATVEGREQSVAAAVKEIGRRILGRNPLDIEALFRLMCLGSYWDGGIILNSAVSGIEQALWDILGKFSSLPVYRLLGGEYRKRIPVYASGWIKPGDRTIADLVNRAVRVVESGFHSLKVPCFLPHDKVVSRGMVDRGVDLVREIRDALDPNVQIMVELHSRFSFELARRALKGLESLDLLWIEEPASSEHPETLAILSGQSRVSFAGGERLTTREQFFSFIKNRLVSYVQPDLCHCGGILEARNIAALAELHDILVAPHNPLSPISTAACIHFAISTPAFFILEWIPEDVPWREEIFPETFYHFEDGCFRWDENCVGLGIGLDEEAAEKHPYQPVDLPVLKNSDGSDARW